MKIHDCIFDYYKYKKFIIMIISFLINLSDLNLNRSHFIGYWILERKKFKRF